jgi:hypothetical protein
MDFVLLIIRQANLPVAEDSVAANYIRSDAAARGGGGNLKAARPPGTQAALS